MKDTARIVIDWRCNMECAYCCNKIPRFRSQFKSVRLNDIEFSRYRVICISGGEPLLEPTLILAVCERVPLMTTTVLYTNGTHLTCMMAATLAGWGVNALNIGVHNPATFEHIIKNTCGCIDALPLAVRFHIQDIYRDTGLETKYPGVKFHYWKMDECDRNNEDRFVIDWS